MIRFPRYDEAAIFKARHRGVAIVVITRSRARTDQDFIVDRCAVTIESLGEYAVIKFTAPRIFVLFFRLPCHDEAAIGEPGDRRVSLRVFGFCVD